MRILNKLFCAYDYLAQEIVYMTRDKTQRLNLVLMLIAVIEGVMYLFRLPSLVDNPILKLVLYMAGAVYGFSIFGVSLKIQSILMHEGK